MLCVLAKKKKKKKKNTQNKEICTLKDQDLIDSTAFIASYGSFLSEIGLLTNGHCIAVKNTMTRPVWCLLVCALALLLRNQCKSQSNAKEK